MLVPSGPTCVVIVVESRRNCATYNRAMGASPDDVEQGNSKRVLGLDVGSKRIGVAVSDPLGITAQGLETLQRRNKRLDFEALTQVAKAYQVVAIVVGLPLRMSGEEGTQAEKMQRFAGELGERLQV